MIRKASKKEFLRILRDKDIIGRLDVYPDKVRSKHNYVVDLDPERLYFFYEDIGGHAAEMHVAAIKDHRGKAKLMITKALGFMKDKGYTKIVTWTPSLYHSTMNMALNLGFTEIFREYHPGYNCDAVYYERLL